MLQQYIELKYGYVKLIVLPYGYIPRWVWTTEKHTLGM